MVSKLVYLVLLNISTYYKIKMTYYTNVYTNIYF